jgi:hypothetical protein
MTTRVSGHVPEAAQKPITTMTALAKCHFEPLWQCNSNNNTTMTVVAMQQQKEHSSNNSKHHTIAIR